MFFFNNTSSGSSEFFYQKLKKSPLDVVSIKLVCNYNQQKCISRTLENKANRKTSWKAFCVIFQASTLYRFICICLRVAFVRFLSAKKTFEFCRLQVINEMTQIGNSFRSFLSAFTAETPNVLKFNISNESAERSANSSTFFFTLIYKSDDGWKSHRL